jgi:hypothetical protein
MIAPIQSMTEQEYRALPGLSYSAMKDLAISPLRFWFRHVNPERIPEEPTPEMKLGSALHCAVLEPTEFDKRYARAFIAEPDCLVTIEDLRGFLRENGVQPKGTRKAEVIAQVRSAFPSAPIYDLLAEEHASRTAGKVILGAGDWYRLARSAESLLEEPQLREILREGRPEAPLFATDPATGIPLKCRVDWLAAKVTLDLKTFSQKREKSIEKTIADAIFYEGYYRQAFTYQLIRRMALGENHGDSEFVIAFVESEEPHETRIRSLLPKVGGNVNMYWERARIELRGLIDTYHEYMRHFGVERPWKYAQEINPLEDAEVPALAY